MLFFLLLLIPLPQPHSYSHSQSLLSSPPHSHSTTLHIVRLHHNVPHRTVLYCTVQSLAGLSVRSVVSELFSQMIVFLFLVDSDTSLLVTVPSFFGILIQMWKVNLNAIFLNFLFIITFLDVFSFSVSIFIQFFYSSFYDFNYLIMSSINLLLKGS